MPSDFQGRVVELCLVVIFEEEDKGIQGREGNELVIGVVLLLTASLVVNLVSLCLIEYIPSEIS